MASLLLRLETGVLVTQLQTHLDSHCKRDRRPRAAGHTQQKPHLIPTTGWGNGQFGETVLLFYCFLITAALLEVLENCKA